MKFFLFFFLTIFSLLLFSQKFGYVDTEHILLKMPGYKEAIIEIDNLSIEQQKKIDKKYVQVDSMLNALLLDEPLLTDDQKDKRQTIIDDKEKEIQTFQTKTFGYEGEIWLKRQELIKPIQDEIYTAVEKIAKKQKLHFIFDKAGDLLILYANPVHDYTDFVLEELGLGDTDDVLDVDK
jgi:outer membrane protein